MATLSGNPYVGPRTFSRQEADRFFGRDNEAHSLLSRVLSERLVLFYAESGAGKSSLLHTKLIPFLESERFVVLPIGRVSGEIPEAVGEVDNIFSFNLMSSIDQRPDPDPRFASLKFTDFLTHLTKRGEQFFYAPERGAGDPAQQPPHVLIIDQFEEILTTHLERWPQREGFFEQLNQALRDDPMLWVVLTLREDYVGGLRTYARLMDNKMKASFHMKRLEAAAAQQAVEVPAEKGGIPFAEGVAKSLVNNLRQIQVHGQEEKRLGQFVEPVQLQVVCYQLWKNLKDSGRTEITQQDLDALGDIDATLAQYYDETIAQICQEHDHDERMLRNWIQEEFITEAHTRGLVYQGETHTAGLSTEIVQDLEKRHLVRAEDRAGARWYELVHDRFVEPILSSNRQWRDKQGAVLTDAERWLEADKDPEQLYDGRQLKQASRAAEEAGDMPLVAAFLAAGRKRVARRRRRRLGILGLLVIGLTALYIWTGNQAIRSVQQAARMTISYAGQTMIVTEPEFLDDRSPVYLFGLDGVRPQFLRTLEGHTDEIYSAALSPDQRFLATVSYDSTLRLWDLENPGDQGEAAFYVDPDEIDLTAVAFSPGGDLLAWGNKEGDVTVYDQVTDEEFWLPNHGELIQTVSFSPDGRHLFVVAASDPEEIYHYAISDLSGIDFDAEPVPMELPGRDY